MIEIKNRFTFEVIHGGEFDSIKECLLDAIENNANLYGANLRGADLRGADLRGADLYGANLYGANLYGANLYGANLRGADLRGADLYGAKLYGANLYGANLRGANLRGADLRGADLYGAKLYGANLYDANLRGANLRGADLRGADLWWCAGNKSEIKSLWFSDAYPITYTFEYLQIGCERHKISDWWSFDDRRIVEMDGKTALKFWKENKELIKQIIESNPAKATGKE